MKRKEVFPSNFLKADDIPGMGETFKMKELKIVEIKDIDTQELIPKPVLFFDGLEKGLILNATNWDRIAKFHGDESKGWAGKKIKLVLEAVTAFGKTSDCIRVATK